MNWERHRVTAVAGLLAIVPPLFFRPSATYVSRIFILMALFAVLTMALNIVFGHTDQLLLFTGATTGIGAYTTVLTAQSMGVSPWMTMLVGALVAGLLGLVVCYVAAVRQLTVIVISILTISLQFSILELINGLRDITGGVTGITFDGLRLAAVETALGVHEHVVLFYLVGAVLVGVLLLYRYLMNSAYGLAFEMIRQDEVAAQSAGIDVVKYKSIAGFVATFIMGLIGPFFAQLSGYVSPGLFTFTAVDVLILVMLVVGGIRTMYGPVVGAAVMIYINEQLRAFAEFRAVIFGLLLMALFLFFRQGMVPYLDAFLEDRLAVGRRFRRFRSD